MNFSYAPGESVSVLCHELKDGQGFIWCLWELIEISKCPFSVRYITCPSKRREECKTEQGICLLEPFTKLCAQRSGSRHTAAVP